VLSSLEQLHVTLKKYLAENSDTVPLTCHFRALEEWMMFFPAACTQDKETPPFTLKPRKRVITGEVSELSDNTWRHLGKFYYDVTHRTLLLGWEHYVSTKQGGSMD